jgi:hypothetical protein
MVPSPEVIVAGRGSAAMTSENVVVAFETELLDEARARVGEDGLSPFANEALRYYLQALRIRELEAEFAARYGPISDDMTARVSRALL